MTRKTPRRDFLLGHRAKEEPAPAPAASEESYLVHVSRRAMACEFEICLPMQYEGGTEIALEALDLVDEMEEQMSIFRASSEIVRINRTAASEPVEVEPRLFELLELAMQLYRETDGAYDITAGPLWEAWGFARRAGAVPAPEQLAEAKSRVGGDQVELDPERKTIRFLRPGVQINLGSIGKGYAVDRCAERLLAGGVRDFLLHGGNSSVMARGSRAGSPVPTAGPETNLQEPFLASGESTGESLGEATGEATGETPSETPGEAPKAQEAAPAGVSQGWTVGIRNPLHLDRRLGELRLYDQALGTSGAQFQSFRHRGRRYGHILDPRTGWPAEGVLSATVVAPTAALADGLSTAFYVMGAESAMAWCRSHPGIATVVVCPGSHGVGMEIHHEGLDQAQWNEPA